MNFNTSTARRIEAIRRTRIQINQKDIMLHGVQNPKGMWMKEKGEEIKARKYLDSLEL